MKKKIKIFVFLFITLIISEGLSYGYLIFSEPLEPHDTYRVGVIGAELANKIAKGLNSNPNHPFLTKLRENEKVPANKVIEVLSLTSSKARQPQQLQTLNLFLGHLDYVLQVDDWTAAQLPDSKYLSYFPADSHLLYPYDQKFWQQFVANFHLDTLAHKMARLAGKIPLLSKSNIYYLIWKLAQTDQKESSIVQLKKNKSKSKNEYEKSLVYFIGQELGLLSWSTKPYTWLVIGNGYAKTKKNKSNSPIIFLEKVEDLPSIELTF